MSHLSSLNVHYKFSLCRSFYEIKYVAQRDTLGHPLMLQESGADRPWVSLGVKNGLPHLTYYRIVMRFIHALHPCPRAQCLLIWLNCAPYCFVACRSCLPPQWSAHLLRMTLSRSHLSSMYVGSTS